MNRWLRLLRHRWLDQADARRALGDAALKRLRDRVVTAERGHSGEIRICVEAGLPLSYIRRRATARERAITMFGKLRVWDTEHNNGVLIYLLLAEHCIEIVADRGLQRHVGDMPWQKMADGMRTAFQRGDYEAGLNTAIDQVSALMREHFPLAHDAAKPNELPDDPLVQ